jgi:hypothetical protein
MGIWKLLWKKERRFPDKKKAAPGGKRLWRVV